jgi:hypothetical protein
MGGALFWQTVPSPPCAPPASSPRASASLESSSGLVEATPFAEPFTEPTERAAPVASHTNVASFRSLAETALGQAPLTPQARLNAPARAKSVRSFHRASAASPRLLVPLAAIEFPPAPARDTAQVHQAVLLNEAFLTATESISPGIATSDAATERAPHTDPAIVRWQSAQAASDQRFRSLFGDQAYNAQLLLRARQDQAASTVP